MGEEEEVRIVTREDGVTVLTGLSDGIVYMAPLGTPLPDPNRIIEASGWVPIGRLKGRDEAADTRRSSEPPR